MRIRSYLVLMAVAILVPVIVFSAVALRMLQQAELSTALRGLAESANGVALLVDRELYSAEAALKVLAASPSLAEGDLKSFYEQAKAADRRPDGWTVLGDGNSQQIINTLRPFGAAMPPPFEKELAERIIRSGRTTVSHVRPGPIAKRMVTTLTVPVRMNDGRHYLLSEVFNTDHFKRLIETATIPKGWLVAIIDGNGRFIARNLNDEALIGEPARPELVEAARQSAAGRIRHRTLEGTEVHDVFTHSAASGWTVAVAAPVDMLDRAARRASMVAAFGMLAAILCAGAVALLFGSRHVDAIQRAARAAVDIGQGKRPETVRSSVIEVNELHTAIRKAGEQLMQAQQYRQQAEAERRSLLVREQSARQTAEAQNKAKDQFLAMLGHELRNPLAPIATAAELLKLPRLDEKRVRYTSEIISRQVEHMNSLLEDLLDVSRVTRGLVTLRMEAVATSTVVSGAVEQVRDLVESRQHHLTLHVPLEPVWVNGDKARLIQVVINLLNNAAKYTPDGGEIALQVEAEGDWVVLSVRDNGIGIAPALLPHVFELFSQGERTPDRSQGGLGLGLALVKSLVELHGGSVTAHSEGTARGSEFIVRLPRIEEAVAQAGADGPMLRCAPSPALRIVIVDDNLDAAHSLALYLKEAGGHRVTVCGDAGSALEAVKDGAPDVMILDIGLPEMDGYELARRLRRTPAADAVLIALTGYGQVHDMERAMAAGFDHHLSKPAEPKQLLDLLESASLR